MPAEANFWLTTAQPPQITAPAQPAHVDVAVIGGGLSGLSAARTLARGGAQVVLFERNSLGWGASSRNGGMVLTGLKLGPQTLIQRYGRDTARRLWQLSLDAITSVETIVREEAIACDFARTGHLETASKPAHFAAYARAAEQLRREFNHPVKIIPRADLQSELGSPLYHGGMLDEASAGVNPAKLSFGLARAAQRAGATLLEQTPVQQIESHPAGGFRLTTPRGIVRADRVFIGTSGYTGGLTPALKKRVIPIGSYIIATPPLAPALSAQLIPNGRMVFDSKHFLYYFRLTPDNRLLFGGRAAFWPESASAVRESAEILRRGMVEVFPQLRDTPADYVWGGNLDFTFDIMPHAGQLDGIHHALGYAGHGVAFATHLGRVMAQNMLGQPVENPLEGLPFPAVPLYNGNPLIHLPLAGLYYKILDWVE